MKNTSHHLRSSAEQSGESSSDPITLQNISDFSPDVISVLDKEGRFLYANAAAKMEWGYDPAELLGSNLLDYLGVADQPQTQQMLDAARSHLVAVRFQTAFRCKDGSSKPMLWSVKWNAKDEVLYSIAREGGELVAAAEKAKRYEQRLYRAYKLAKLGWWEWNIHGEQNEATDELYELCGISKEQYPVFNSGVYLSLVHPDDLSFVLENVAIFWKAPSHQYRHRVRKPSGEVINVELNVETIKDQNNNVVQVHCTMRDITEQIRYEEERSTLGHQLQQANHNLYLALESMSDGFFTTDRNWTITYVNQRAAAMLGERKRDDYIGRNLWECFPEAVGNIFYTEYHRAAAENTFVLVEEYYPPLNIWFEVSVYPHANGLSFYIRDISERKQQERELMLSNERFHLVTKATNEAIWDWNIVTQQVEWGEGFFTAFGYHRDRLKNKLDFVIERIHPDDKNRVLESVSKIIAGTESNWMNEFRFRKADETYAYVLDKGFVIRDEKDIAIRMVGAMQDITDRKKQEKRLEFIAKATSEVIWERDIDAEKVVVHAEKFQELFGYTLDGNLLSHSFWLERVHPEDIQAVHENREYAFQHGLDFHLTEYRFRKADGSWAYVKDRTFLIRDFNGKPVSLLGALEDVTRQRLFEKALMESEQSYRQLFNNAPLPTIIHDEETFVILDVNNAMIEQYGYSREELLSMSIFEFHPREENNRISSSIKEITTSARNNMGIIEHVKKNGERILVEVSATRITYKGRSAMLATANDVTEKLRLQKQLIEEKVNHQKSITRAAIQAQENERSEIGKELHDNVNQLMAAAKLYVENIRHAVHQRDYLIDQSIALINKSISETRRLSHALVTPTIQDVGLKDSLLELIETFQELEIFDVRPVLDFDESKIEAGLDLTIYRILQECFSNTVKYARASFVTVGIRLKRKKLQVTYTDNGVGFDPATNKKGIGLKNIINRAEAYGGKVKFTTSQQGGFALKLTFPAGEN